MKVAIIGAGPTGLLMGMGLARRGHRVVAVDRDGGPSADGSWDRKGVMQFHHAHAFRGQVLELLTLEAPAARQAWIDAGAEPIEISGPDGRVVAAGVRSRRMTFESALRSAALQQPGLSIRSGHVDQVLVDAGPHGRARGLSVGGAELEADLVLDASGRSSRATRSLRSAPQIGGGCGIAYVDRQYQLREGVPTPPLTNPIAWQGNYDGYVVIVFIHERGIFSALIIRSTDDRSLVPLRHNASFAAAAAAIPGLAAWTDPTVARPLTDVLPGGAVLNLYRSQRAADGELAAPGLISVGDAVCTTTPNFGRGVTTSFLQAAELLRLIDEYGSDGATIGEYFDIWCEANMRPWVEDHVRMDIAQNSRWAGDDIDLAEKLPSDLIMAAAERDPSIGAALGPYLSMRGLPSCLDAVEPKAKAVYAGGWRPGLHPGPGRAELADIALSAAPLGTLGPGSRAHAH